MRRKYINEQQVRLYMKYRQDQTLTQEACAAKVGFSTRSAYDIEHHQHHTQKPKNIRSYKTRKSAIDTLWETELKPMVEKNPDLQPKTLLIYLQRTYIDEAGDSIYSDSILRTLQRRVANWQALHGVPKDIFFPQTHIPGVQALSDFTHMNRKEVIVNGLIFKHMLYHFRLIYSKWSYVKVIQSGESFQALSEGLQEALLALGGAPKEHRTDSLSAAFKNLTDDEKQDLTNRYQELCHHYNMIPTRNNKGESHENGSVESSHGHLKNRIEQELLLRDSNCFNSVAEYEQWIQNIVLNSNKRNSKNISLERASLQTLPKHKTADYEVFSAKVSNLSMLVVKNMTYSMPSRLAGHTLTLHIYQNKIDTYLGGSKVLSFDRLYRTANKTRYVINYHHIIHALIKKPRAFRFCKYRDEILPNAAYKLIWNYIDTTESRDSAPKIMLRILKIAADYDCEYKLEQKIIAMMELGQPIVIQQIECEFNVSNHEKPIIDCNQHSLEQYDRYINCYLSSGVSYESV